jgi:hypothetical protein
LCLIKTMLMKNAHEALPPELEADLQMIFTQMPTDDQAILEFVINELDASYNN